MYAVTSLRQRSAPRTPTGRTTDHARALCSDAVTLVLHRHRSIGCASAVECCVAPGLQPGRLACAACVIAKSCDSFTRYVSILLLPYADMRLRCGRVLAQGTSDTLARPKPGSGFEENRLFADRTGRVCRRVFQHSSNVAATDIRDRHTGHANCKDQIPKPPKCKVQRKKAIVHR